MRDGNKVVLDRNGVALGGKHEILLCASVFYFRIPRAHWRDRIRKLKATGYNCADVYFPWNYHEKPDGGFDFSGDRDVGAFLRMMSEEGIAVIARPGPYICSEWTGGALPARILESGMPLRTSDPRFLAEVGKWYDAVLREILPYEFGKGGSVILIQLENELDFFDCPDVEGYIGALRDLARAAGATVPLFCCAGQYGTRRAGCDVEGVYGALNCYPSSEDPTFDAELRNYAGLFAARGGEPLMVSETNRDHFILRRELSAGAKLVGAYCQIAGTNSGYGQAANNWGSPVGFLMTEYDFGSMIDAAGNYRGEANHAVILAAFLRAMGEKFAAATPAAETVVPDRADVVTTAGGLSVLNLSGGGKAVCVPNFSHGDGAVTFRVGGRALTVHVGPWQAPFALFDVDLSAYGVAAKITRSNCEPIALGKDKLVFVASGCDPLVGLDFGTGEIVLGASRTVCGVKVEVLSFDEAVAGLVGTPFGTAEYKQLPVRVRLAEAGFPYKAASGTTFGTLGIREGKARYTVTAPAGKQLVVYAPCDIVTAAVDGKRLPTVVGDGRDLTLPASQSGRYTVTVEKWGHSNFDDPQAPSLRLSVGKGAAGFGVVASDTKIGMTDFTLLDRYGDARIALGDGMPVRLGINKWNTTRMPVICAYTVPVTRTSDRLRLSVSDSVEILVYVDETLCGACAHGAFDLTPFVPRGKAVRLTLVYRKRVWTQDCGEAHLIALDDVPFSAETCDGAATAGTAFSEGAEAVFPLAIGEGKAIAVDPSVIDREGFVRFGGKNIELTCIVGGAVRGRLLLGWDNAPLLTGGDPERLYVSPSWLDGRPLLVLIEPLGEGATLERVTFEAQ